MEAEIILHNLSFLRQTISSITRLKMSRLIVAFLSNSYPSGNIFNCRVLSQYKLIYGTQFRNIHHYHKGQSWKEAMNKCPYLRAGGTLTGKDKLMRGRQPSLTIQHPRLKMHQPLMQVLNPRIHLLGPTVRMTQPKIFIQQPTAQQQKSPKTKNSPLLKLKETGLSSRPRRRPSRSFSTSSKKLKKRRLQKAKRKIVARRSLKKQPSRKKRTRFSSK